MAKFWETIRNLKSFGRDKTRKKKQQTRRRTLLVEQLENREVLSVASIVGTIFDDNSQAVPGVSVELTYEGADRTFNTADDVVRNAFADAGGHYQFIGLDEGSYKLELPNNANNQQRLAGLLPPPGTLVKDIEVTTQHVTGRGATDIDEFTTPQTATDVETAGAPLVTIQSDARVANEAIGGERDLFVDWTGGGPGEVALKVNPFGEDILQFDTSASARGDRVVIWDGPDGDPFSTDYAGLNHADLTEGGNNIGLQLQVWADHGGGEVEIRIYTDANNFSVGTVMIPETNVGDGSDTNAVALLFAPDGSGRDVFTPAGGTGANFSDIGAIELEIVDAAATVSVDGQMEFLGTLVGPQTVDFTHTAAQPAIHVEKSTNGVDADDAFDPAIPVVSPGGAINWTYVVTNEGNVPLANVNVRDDNGTALVSGDDFSATYVSGDTNSDNLLDLTETWTYTATATALDLYSGNVTTVNGQIPTNPQPTYENFAVATGTGGGQTVTDNDPSHYGNPPLAALGDCVWHDVNGNGIQDPGEAPINGVTVTLTSPGRDNVSGTADDITQTTTTGANGSAGKYIFEDLEPGLQYKVTFSNLPSNFEFTTHNGGDDTLDSDADPITGMTQLVTLGPGERNLTLDAGIVPLPAALGNFVWNDLNKNGLQDPGEPGVSGVKVTLTSPGPDNVSGTGDDLMDMQNTGSNGEYLFSDLTPNLQYKVTFSNVPADFAFTTANSGDDTRDNDADPTTGMTQLVSLSPGETNLTLDAGIVALPGSLGDYVWFDSDANGVQDNGEIGLNGVTVRLTDANGNVLATQQTRTNPTTGDNGYYLFENLDAGSYKVQFDLNTAPSAPQQPWEFTSANTGTNDANDSDATLMSPNLGMSQVVVLAQGEHNPTIDAGLISNAAPLDSSLGNFVWYDNNRNGIQDVGEAGVPGVSVQLLDSNGIVQDTRVTDANGNYIFDIFPPDVPGTFSVRFANLPAGFAVTSLNQGGDDALDSDVNGSTLTTDPIFLPDGSSNLTLDMGIYRRLTKFDFLVR